MRLDTVLIERVRVAFEKYGEQQSTHEGLGVITEEYQELIDAIRHNDRAAIVEEALDLACAAMQLAGTAERCTAEFAQRSGLK